MAEKKYTVDEVAKLFAGFLAWGEITGRFLPSAKKVKRDKEQIARLNKVIREGLRPSKKLQREVKKNVKKRSRN